MLRAFISFRTRAISHLPSVVFHPRSLANASRREAGKPAGFVEGDSCTGCSSPPLPHLCPPLPLYDAAPFLTSRLASPSRSRLWILSRLRDAAPASRVAVFALEVCDANCAR